MYIATSQYTARKYPLSQLSISSYEIRFFSPQLLSNSLFQSFRNRAWTSVPKHISNTAQANWTLEDYGAFFVPFYNDCIIYPHYISYQKNVHSLMF